MVRHSAEDFAAVQVRQRIFKKAIDTIRRGDFIYAHVVINGTSHELPAEVLDVRQQVCDDGSHESQYYVHYEDRDRRMDEWIPTSRVLKDLPKALRTAKARAQPGEMFPLTRSQRRIQEEFSHMPRGITDMDATTAKLEKQHEERTKIKNVQRVVFGEWEIDVWYYSPYPSSVVDGFVETLYICGYCLFYYNDIHKYRKHVTTGCKRRQPPGQVIYRDGNIEVYEVFGNVYKLYCQCLCLLSKLFLDHKTLYYEVENFRFYVLCESDANGAHVVGHFSKEVGTNNNLACIMVLPPFQRKGYGKLLIQLSYAISKREHKIGTPEKPLSDLGKVGACTAWTDVVQVSYRSYWWWVLLGVIEQHSAQSMLVSELSLASGIHQDDIISTFLPVQMTHAKKGSDQYVICSAAILQACKKLSFFKPPKLLLKEEALRWSANEVRLAVLREQDLVVRVRSPSPDADFPLDVVGEGPDPRPDPDPQHTPKPSRSRPDQPGSSKRGRRSSMAKAP